MEFYQNLGLVGIVWMYLITVTTGRPSPDSASNDMTMDDAMVSKSGFSCSRLMGLIHVVSLFTSAKEVMFSPGFVCEFVNKITQKLKDGF